MFPSFCGRLFVIMIVVVFLLRLDERSRVMALKLTPRSPLLRNLGAPPFGAVWISRFLRSISLSSHAAARPVWSNGCRRFQPPGLRCLGTIAREPTFVSSTSVRLPGEAGPRFHFARLHGPTVDEELAFCQRLQNCSSSHQVFKLLRSVGIRSDAMAAAALHRVADLEQDDKSLKDPSVLDTDIIRALCFQLELDSRQLTDAGLVSALLAGTRLFLDPWSSLMMRLISESQERLDRGQMTLGQLCTLGQAMLAIEGPTFVMLDQVMEQIQKQKPSQWCLDDLIAVYRFLRGGVCVDGKHQDLLNAMHLRAIKVSPCMDPAAVSGLLSALVELSQMQAVPLVISLCKQAVRHVPHFTDEELTAVLGALMHFGHSDHYFVKAMEKHVPTMTFKSQPETVTKVIQFFARRNILSPKVFDAVAESFVYRADDYNTSQVARQIMALGKVGYLPPNAGAVFRKVELMLHARGSHFQPRTLLNLLHSCTLVERFPINFIPKVFSSFFLQQLQGKDTSFHQRLVSQASVFCPFFSF